MPTLTSALAAELRHEATTTRRLLERIPDDKLDWRPHERSMTLGRLAGHIGELPGWGRSTVEQSQVDLAAVPEDQRGAVAESVERLLADFDRGVAGFTAALDGAEDSLLFEPWQLRNGEQVILDMPRAAALRGFIISHMIHHRGQLTVYLRLLDVPLPQTYGPTADEGW
ncbi:MAG: DinB family protein [Thermoanaerobaculia bacterium]